MIYYCFFGILTHFLLVVVITTRVFKPGLIDFRVTHVLLAIPSFFAVLYLAEYEEQIGSRYISLPIFIVEILLICYRWYKNFNKKIDF
jgi:hypothetical protein